MGNTVFYSWQSDTEAKYNRTFHQECLKAAFKKLKEDLDWVRVLAVKNSL